MNNPKPEEQIHRHRWIKNQASKLPFCDQPYKGGSCKALRVTPGQLDHINAEWNSYFDLVHTTPAYLDFMAMKEGWKAKNKPLIAGIHKRVMARNKVVQNQYGDDVLEPTYELLSQPELPDPRNSKTIYVVEVAR